MSDAISHGRTLRNQLAPHWGRVAAYQWGLVSATHLTSSPPTVDVKLDGASTATTGIYFLSGYYPKAGDVVVVGRMQGPAQTARFIIGPLAQTGAPPCRELLGRVTLGAGTTSFTIPDPTLWNTITLHFRDCHQTSSTSVDNVAMRFNGDTSSNYEEQTIDVANNSGTYSSTSSAVDAFFPWTCVIPGTSSGFTGSADFTIPGANSSNPKQLFGLTRFGGGGNPNQASVRWGTWNGGALTSLGFLSSIGPGSNTLAGTVDVYGET